MFWRKICHGLSCREERGHIYEVATKNHLLNDHSFDSKIGSRGSEAMQWENNYGSIMVVLRAAFRLEDLSLLTRLYSCPQPSLATLTTPPPRPPLTCPSLSGTTLLNRQLCWAPLYVRMPSAIGPHAACAAAVLPGHSGSRQVTIHGL